VTTAAAWTPKHAGISSSLFSLPKGAGKGTGLGLTTVRSIVTTNGGLIQFESEADRGTRVMILLPRALHSPASEFPDVVISHSDRSRTTF
jgi:hypothetical protein